MTGLPIFAFMLQLASTLPCEQGTPIRASVAAINAAPNRFLGRCVVVEALSDGISLFTSQAALVEQHRNVQRRYLNRLELRHRIGVYHLPQLPPELQNRQFEKGVKWRVTGVVDTCGAMYDRAERANRLAPVHDGEVRLTMMSGHCHMWGGPVLVVRTAEREQ